MVRKRGGRKRALGLRAPMKAPDRPNACWSLDFVHDQMTDGRRFRILGVVDECTRECLADTSAWRANSAASSPGAAGRKRSIWTTALS